MDIRLDRTTVFLEGLGHLGVEITHDGRSSGTPGVFTVTPGLTGGSGTDELAYEGSWDIEPKRYDVLTYDYDDDIGNYQDIEGNFLPSQSLVLFNCLDPDTDQIDETPPVWINPLELSFKTNEVVDITLTDHIDNTGNTLANTEFTLKSDEIETMPVGLEISGVRLFGTVGPLEGGVYSPSISARNTKGETLTIDAKITVVQTIGAPIVDPIPNLLGQVQGSLIETIVLPNYLVSTGDPSGIEIVLWIESQGGLELSTLGLSIDAVNGLIFGSINPLAEIKDYIINITTTNESGFSTISTFTIFVVAATVELTPTPLIAAWHAGNAGHLGCSATGVTPTWKADPINLSRESSLSSGIDPIKLINSVASDGGNDILSYALSSGSYPPSPATFSLNTVTGEITGDANGVAAGNYFQTYTMTTAFGTSEDSPTHSIIIFDQATVIPIILSIEAAEGTNDVIVNFSEPVHVDTNLGENYEAGWVFKVKGVVRSHTMIFGGGTSRLTFRLSGASFTDGNLIEAEYTD